jgi:PEP-CTERM motif-containing protein
MKWTRGVVVVCAIALCAGTAGATTVDWGVHDAVELGSNQFTAPGAFEDRYDFSVTNGGLLLSAVTNDAAPTFDITGGLVELFTSGNALIGSLSFDSTAVNTSFSVETGNYYYRVTGTVIGSAGSYLISSAVVAPVPEPASAALVLMGIAAIALRGRRHTS